MNKENLYEAMGNINEKRIHAAHAPTTKKKPVWLKWGAMAACLALMVCIGGGHLYLENYVDVNNIQVQSVAPNEDAIAPGDVTPEQAEKMGAANELHNAIVQMNYDWYGACYYDFEQDAIIVAVTENTSDNQNTILAAAGDVPVQFSECKYSYQQLATVYDELEAKSGLLKAAGVERYNISLEKNCVNVYVASPNRNAALYLANEIDDSGVIVFKTHAPLSDG